MSTYICHANVHGGKSLNAVLLPVKKEKCVVFTWVPVNLLAYTTFPHAQSHVPMYDLKFWEIHYRTKLRGRGTEICHERRRKRERERASERERERCGP